MATCKDCEHYEVYDGPERKNSKDELITFICTVTGGRYYYHSTDKCDGYVPKKPKEPETSKTICPEGYVR